MGPLIFLNCLFFTRPSPASLDNPRLLSGTVDDLVSSIASGSKPISLLKQLYSLKALVQRKEMDKLEKALQELNRMSLLSAGWWYFYAIRRCAFLSNVFMPVPVHTGLFMLGSALSTSLTCPCMLIHVSLCLCLSSMRPIIDFNCSPERTCPYLPPLIPACHPRAAPSRAASHAPMTFTKS